jgi:hypothetical protein
MTLTLTLTRWLEQLEAAMRSLGFGEVRHTAECIAACRRGAMACER